LATLVADGRVAEARRILTDLTTAVPPATLHSPSTGR
jgi:hypothetical protein